MKNKGYYIIFISLILFYLNTFSKIQKDIYNPNNFRRITTDADSVKNMAVIYKSTLDTSIILVRNYWDDGKLQTISFYKNRKRDGHWIIYNSLGTLEFEGSFSDGLPVDTQRIYFHNGNVSIIEVYNKGKPTGEWKYYNVDGTIKRVERYKR